MIQFSCTCHHVFSVTDDQSGTELQCPLCGRLVTVPTANELAAIERDGTYKIGGEGGPEIENAERVAQLKRIYAPGRVDEQGNEIDLRSHVSPLDYQRVGVDPLDLTQQGPDRPASPKYDPETGELIRPMEVRTEPLQNVRKVAPLTDLTEPTRRRRSVERLSRVAPIEVFAKLFKPANLFVMAMIVLVHLFYGLAGAIMMLGAFIVFLAPLGIFFVIVAHYGSVIDETGPTSQDELPRPLRNVNWHDDLWGPFSAVMLATIYCYAPAGLLMYSTIPLHLRLILAAAFAIFGTFLAPAVLLTTATSGSYVNLRPDRVIGTIKAIGGVYPVLIGLFLIAVPAYVLAFIGLNLRILTMFVFQHLQVPEPAFSQWAIVLPLLAAGIFFTHLFCWTLGQTYRVYHRKFPWAYQGPIRPESDGDAPRGFEVVGAHTRKPPPPDALKPLPMPDRNS